jgi:predicted permease
MGLRAVHGRLIGPRDDGQGAAPVAVLTHRFWLSAFQGDPAVVGRTLRFTSGTATVVGVLEPSVPYPVRTEIIANVVTSSHHLSATMQTDRRHRMTELFGRLAPGASVEEARAELVAAHAAMMTANPGAYSTNARVRLSVTPLRDQITAPARTILLVLLSAAAIVFVIACSNVANLILARSVRRESELAVRAALGASRGALRRTLLAESLVLCGAGALFGVLLARPLVSVVAEYASRFSVRALDVTVDSTVVWVGVGLAMAAAGLLAYVPRLPTSTASAGLGLAAGGVRMTGGTNRRLRAFATTQIAFSFVLLAGAGMLVTTLIALQAGHTGYETRNVLVLDVPGFALPPDKGTDRHREFIDRIARLPGVEGVAGGNFVPWRDAGSIPTFQFAAQGYSPAAGEEDAHARPRFVSPGFFATVGIPLVAGRDFTLEDLRGRERVVIVSQSIAQRFFPNGDAVDRTIWATDSDWWRRPVPIGQSTAPTRIVGVVADVDDEHVDRGLALTVYSPLGYGFSGFFGDRLFVRAAGDPMALLPALTRVLRESRPNQVVENPATLEDVRVKLMLPERLHTFVLTGFAGIALLIAVVGVSGVLAFSVSARMREFGIRLAVGSAPRHLLLRVLAEGASIVAIGIVAGAAAGYVLAGVASSYFEHVRVPGVRAAAVAATVLAVSAVTAALMPAVRASRVDVLRALRSE